MKAEITTKAMAKGHAYWTTWAEDHSNRDFIDTIIPQNISIELAGYILADGINQVQQILHTHGLEDTTIIWSEKRYNAEQKEIPGYVSQ